MRAAEEGASSGATRAWEELGEVLPQKWAVLVCGFPDAGLTVSRKRTTHHPYADH